MAFIPYADPTIAAQTVPTPNTAYPASDPTSPQRFVGDMLPYSESATGGAASGTGATPQALADFNAQKGVTMGSINTNISDTANAYHSGILDYLDSRRAAQKGIDTKSTQNELARMQGQQGILDMVGNGVKSGGVILANGNSGSSSAGEALAKAYSLLGRQQMSGVGNQFAQGQAGIQSDQENLNAGDATQIRHSQDKTGTINSIVNSATTALTSLNAAAATASITDRVQIDQEIARIKQEALTALSAYDSELTGGIAGQAPKSATDVRASASGLLTSGVAPENSFNYTTEAPAQFQNTGGFASSLPIFTNNKRQPALA